MFLHKAIKPARLFVNRILALLQEMGEVTAIAIDEASKQDLQWFIACARAVNCTISIYKCLQPRIHHYMDASLHGLGGSLGASVLHTHFQSMTRLEYSALGSHQRILRFAGLFSPCPRSIGYHMVWLESRGLCSSSGEGPWPHSSCCRPEYLAFPLHHWLWCWVPACPWQS
jgi:hypothetical protein